MSALVGRNALVTGGASGIGAACARALAARGATVTVADVDSAGAAALAGEIGGRAWVWICSTSRRWKIWHSIPTFW